MDIINLLWEVIKTKACCYELKQIFSWKWKKAIWEEEWLHAGEEMYFISAFYGILSCKGEMLYREKMGIIEN